METGRAFITDSATFLKADFLPRIVAVVERLDDDQIWWRPNKSSNSIGNLMLHLSGNVRQWIIGGVGQEPVTRDRPREFNEPSEIPKHELLTSLSSAVDAACRVLDSLESSALGQRRMIQGTEITVLYAIYHVVEHFSMHAGQILMLAKMILDEDLKLYEFPDGAAKKRW